MSSEWTDPRFLFTIIVFIGGIGGTWALTIHRVGGLEKKFAGVAQDVKDMLSRISHIEGFLASATNAANLGLNREFGQRRRKDNGDD